MGICTVFATTAVGLGMLYVQQRQTTVTAQKELAKAISDQTIIATTNSDLITRLQEMELKIREIQRKNDPTELMSRTYLPSLCDFQDCLIRIEDGFSSGIDDIYGLTTVRGFYKHTQEEWFSKMMELDLLVSSLPNTTIVEALKKGNLACCSKEANGNIAIRVTLKYLAESEKALLQNSTPEKPVDVLLFFSTSNTGTSQLYYIHPLRVTRP